jgi:hypothetical protein
MQPNRSQLEKVVEIVQNGQSGLICLPENPTEDAIAAATALYLGLMQLGKNMSIASVSPIKSDLIASDKIQGEVATSGDSLVVSFPYQDGSIDKVDYYIQNDLFNIVITPRAGLEKINQKEVKFNYTGGTIDFIVTIDTTNLRSLGQLYADNQEQFKGKKIINIDRHLTNSFFGTANYVNRTVSSTAELVLGILQTMNVQIDQDIATNLYAGVVAATNNYSANTVNAQTFEASAYLLKQGAAKGGKPQAAGQPEQASQPRQPQQQQAPRQNNASPIQPPQARTPVQPQQPAQQMPQPQQARPPQNSVRSFDRPKSAKPANAIERDRTASVSEGNDFDNTDEDNEEWLKPKIFKPQGPGTSEMG